MCSLFIINHKIHLLIRGKEINQFLASHDVVKVDHTSADHGEIITTIVYRKVIKEVDPWGDKTSEDD